MEKIEKVDSSRDMSTSGGSQSLTSSNSDDGVKKAVKSLQTCHEGNKIYVITYFVDQTVLIKMYEKTLSDGAYDYVGAVEVA